MLRIKIFLFNKEIIIKIWFIIYSIIFNKTFLIFDSIDNLYIWNKNC